MFIFILRAIIGSYVHPITGHLLRLASEGGSINSLPYVLHTSVSHSHERVDKTLNSTQSIDHPYTNGSLIQVTPSLNPNEIAKRALNTGPLLPARLRQLPLPPPPTALKHLID